MSDLDVLEDFSRRSGLKDIEDMVMVCRVCKKQGGNLQEALINCNNIIGDKISLEKELKTVMAQKKFEGRVVAIAPFLLMTFIKIISPGYVKPLIDVAAGRLLSTISLILIAAAWITRERVNSIEI